MKPDDMVVALTGWFNGSLISQVFQWTSYIVLGLVIAGFFYLLILLIQYRYKIYYFTLNTDQLGANGELPDKLNLQNAKFKHDLARPYKDKGVAKWKMLWSRKSIEPVPFKYIASKRRVYMMRTGPDTFIPTLRERSFVLGNHVFENYLPLPTDIKFWQQNEIKQATLETVQEGYHKQMMAWAGGTIIVILIFAAVTIWFILSAAKGSVEKIDLVAAAVQSLKGVGPG